MIENDLFNAIGNYGFPAVVTAWFMFRTEKIIAKNTEGFEKITGVIEKCHRR